MERMWAGTQKPNHIVITITKTIVIVIIIILMMTKRAAF